MPEPAAEPAGWWDELQQLRRGLSKSSPQAAKTGGKQPDAKAGTKTPRNAPTSEERALGSILNQFQDLQGELANRPAKQPTTK